ncbi:MAG: cyclic nucleotide-binding domain-containing protein [Gammaproteobacteria bacterium]|nr:cyclic nucleotide-binding domain-containing protein [Gammaproteobacteria bacterium]
MDGTHLTADVLRRFTPLDSLKRENIAALIKKIQVRELEPGKLLFREGDNERRTYYVLTGTLQLKNQDGGLKSIRGGSDESRNALSPMLPRRWTATAQDRVEFISIDTDLLDVMLTWDQTGSYEFSDLNGTQSAPKSDDWMTTLLQTKAFHRVPPANIQAIVMRMQKVQYSAGEVIIKQGDEGDYFYLISHGKCGVTRETPLNKDGIKLAELNVGDTFGEEALISEAKRNATVTMLVDGAVMRLGKDDFRQLLNEPMIDRVSYQDARQIVARGGKWLDVRLPSEYETFHEPGAINIPLYFLRLKIGTLDPSVTYVLCCDTSRRSSAGSFILNERGFTTTVLQGGLEIAEQRSDAGY